MHRKSAFIPLKMKSLTGFTLIELMIVMAVIAILIGIILPTIGGFREEAQMNRARGELSTLRTAMESYYIHNSNTYPAALASLTTANPRIVTAIPTDPFRSPAGPYQHDLSTNGRFYVIFSVGPGITGSAVWDDVTNTVSETNGANSRRPLWVSNGDTQTGNF